MLDGGGRGTAATEDGAEDAVAAEDLSRSISAFSILISIFFLSSTLLIARNFSSWLLVMYSLNTSTGSDDDDEPSADGFSKEEKTPREVVGSDDDDDETKMEGVNVKASTVAVSAATTITMIDARGGVEDTMMWRSSLMLS